MAWLSVIFIGLACPAYGQHWKSGSNDFRHFVTTLPQVDRVEILKVTIPQTDMNKIDCTRSDLVCGAGRFPLMIREAKTLSGEDAARISAIWRKLKPGDSRGGCFYPDLVLRFCSGNRLLLETELCLNCHLIRLPNDGIISIDGSMEALYSLQDFLTPNSRSKSEFENFKAEMMPSVNQQVTIIGILKEGKIGLLIPFKEGYVYIFARKDSDLAKSNALDRLYCHTVKVTGTLRYHPEPPPPPPSRIPVVLHPEHFYLDVADAKVVNVYPLRSRRVNKNAMKHSRRVKA